MTEKSSILYPADVKMKPYSIRLPDSIVNQYRRRALADRRSLREAIRLALEEHLGCGQKRSRHNHAISQKTTIRKTTATRRRT
jgi:hypothetical protein